MSDRVPIIHSCLKDKLAPKHIEIIDDSAAHIGHASNTGGGHFRVIIVADQFQGKSTLQRHRMVYEAVAHLIPSEIHALSIQAKAPNES